MTWKNSSRGSKTGSSDWSQKLTDWWKKEATQETTRLGVLSGPKKEKKYPLKEEFLRNLKATKRS